MSWRVRWVSMGHLVRFYTRAEGSPVTWGGRKVNRRETNPGDKLDSILPPLTYLSSHRPCKASAKQPQGATGKGEGGVKLLSA